MSNTDPPNSPSGVDDHVGDDQNKDLRIKELEQENKRLKAQLSKFANNAKQMQRLNQENKELKVENTRLLSNLDSSEGKLKVEIQTLKSDIDRLQQEKQRLEQHKIDAENQLKTFVVEKKDQSLNNQETEKITELEAELLKSNQVIENQEVMLDKLEKELLELDKKYDQYISRLKKQIASLEKDVEVLEEKNTKLSNSNFSHLRPKSQSGGSSSGGGSESDDLRNRVKQLLKSWPGGIKLRNLAMSMGISVSATNEFIIKLEQEGYVTVDRENAVNSNPMVYPL